jgi:DNA-directed RNA polymerase subunit RPC12/RpoP
MAAYQHCRDLGHDHAWECDECGFIYTREDEFDEHFETHHEQYVCDHCDGKVLMDLKRSISTTQQSILTRVETAAKLLRLNMAWNPMLLRVIT